MPAFEPLLGWRVVAAPGALAHARWEGDDVHVLRFAPDEAFGLGASGVKVDDPHAIAELERGLVGAWLTRSGLREWVAPHVEWGLPEAGPALAQGFVARIPAKLWLPSGDAALLVTHAVHAHDLAERLGWLP